MSSELLIPEFLAQEVTTVEESWDLPLGTQYFSLRCRTAGIDFRFSFTTGHVAVATEAGKAFTVSAGGAYNSPEKFSIGEFNRAGTSILTSGKLRMYLATVSGTGIIECLCWYGAGKKGLSSSFG